jgi:type IV secretion system protein VirB10
MSDASEGAPAVSESVSSAGGDQTKESPDHLALRAPPRPVVRLNRRNLMLATAVVGLGVFGATWWALRPAAPRAAAAEAPPRAEQVPRPEGLSALPRDYGSLAKIPLLGAPVGELGRPVVRAEEEAGFDRATAGDSYWPDPAEDAARAGRLQQHDEELAAAKAQVFFQLAQRGAANPSEGTAARQTGGPLEISEIGRPPADGDAGSAGNGQSAKQAFLDQAVDPSIYATGTLQVPRSPYEVMAGTVIPAALLTGINSDLPGQIIATVTGNVFDTVSGEHLLIPQGSRLLGQYDSQVAAGQRRVLLVWTRLLLPDGSSLVLDRLPGVDLAGYAGLEDGVDQHWKQVFTGAVLATLIGINTELASPDRSGDSGSMIIATRDSAQDTVNQIGQQLTRRNLNQQPTLTIRPGYPVRVIVNRDLVLRPYGATEAQAASL